MDNPLDIDWEASDNGEAQSPSRNQPAQAAYSIPVEIYSSDILSVDIQGIDWSQMTMTRDEYRTTRLRDYEGNYTNLTPHPRRLIKRSCAAVIPGSNYYSFRYTKVPRRIPIIHFQLRNLMWATSKNHVYYAADSAVLAWNPILKRSSTVLDMRVYGLDHIRISTMCAKLGFLMIGGFNGEFAVQRLHHDMNWDHGNLSSASSTAGCHTSAPTRQTPSWAQARSGFITTSYNGITNHIEIEETRAGRINAIVSSNDEYTRILDFEQLRVVSAFKFPWAVNCTTLSIDKRMLCVVGDDRDTLITDAQNGEVLATLTGHSDYSFACAWSPCGRVVATGNQDKTCRLYDVRSMSQPFCMLRGRLSAIRSIRFSDDGKFMAMAEAADFVHIFDMSRLQEILHEGHHLNLYANTSPRPSQFAHTYAQRTDVEEEVEEENDDDDDDDEGEEEEEAPGIMDFFGEISGMSFSPGDGEQFYIGNAHESYGCILEYERTRPTIGNLDSVLI
ncbi:hypothetical protein SeLEV6574_g02539 [Synchytrium endobioticum]|uniref:Uncharacterized protein n=1 Tax=Synchytrium endobioticum TaxID=286115 RepID=A0A507D8G8_9FUNG|nr:hypothetical protein SeLEV6574_g02539 [Synchytrium endobioticum]